jgi:16S rRNA (cytidine1402-2'-O)-methyltransferase
MLREVDLIAAEDTRRSRQLLAHYDIATPVTSYHEHNERSKGEVLLRELVTGRSVALVADAGTPCISDPGYRLVRAARERGIEVVSVPGPSAVIAALAVSGLPCSPYFFHGFFPRKRGHAEKLLSHIQTLAGAHVFFEAPTRLAATLRLIGTVLPEAEVCVARELTKMFEEVRSGTAAQLAERFSVSPLRGECVIVLHAGGGPAAAPILPPEELRARVEQVMAEQRLSRREAVQRVATELNLPRRTVYSAAVSKSHDPSR